MTCDSELNVLHVALGTTLPGLSALTGDLERPRAGETRAQSPSESRYRRLAARRSRVIETLLYPPSSIVWGKCGAGASLNLG
jgi:hypothetical protein